MNSEDIRTLAGAVRCLTLDWPIQQAEFQAVVDAHIGKKNSVAKVQAAFNRLVADRQPLIESLTKAIQQGNKAGLRLESVRRLVVALDGRGGFDSPSPLDFVFDSVAELEELAERTKAGSRVQPDHPITKWVNQHSKGRKDSVAVKAYIEIYGGDYSKLYQDLANDRKKHRRQQFKHG